MKDRLKRCLVAAALLFAAAGLSAQQKQEWAVKTNLLYDATLTINAGIETTVNPHWSIDLSGNLNAWNMGNGRRWKHWLVQPEARYWLCEATSGHFFAIHPLGGKYNIGHTDFKHDLLGLKLSNLADHRYQGWLIGAGIGYGYSWLINPHWSVEAEAAIGWIHTRYDVFECKGCGKRTGNGTKDFVAPTKLAINLVYVF